MAGELSGMLADLQEEAVLAQVKERLGAGEEPLLLVEECRRGMAQVGERYEAGEYFLSDLVMSAEVFRNAVSLIEPYLEGGITDQAMGKVVIGTSQGDIHDIGKNIVGAMLRCSGFEVHDLGVDVAPQSFVDKVKETGAAVVGISVLLTTSFATLKESVDALRAGCDVKVLIGGGPVSQMVCSHVGADGWGKDAMEAVGLCRKYAGARQ
ncbi:MAG: cobalamin-dependent protein [Dehalococcoidia bacterium]|nr:cobalamin-dependent protein [Dehalococcoidia bacterium]